eukprot:m.1333458 g.1333458  ORF g.1333458 m.1333458 type:complete len:185 (+) comp24871_c0_seq3:2438-2992(+)
MLRTTVDGLHGIGYGSKELRCACGTPYSEYCKNCDIIGRHALGLIASSQSGALHGSILSRDANEHYLETSFSNEDEPTADAMTVTPTSQRGSALPVTDGIKCPGFVGYLDDAHCATLVRDASTGDFLVRQVDAKTFEVIVNTFPWPKPTHSYRIKATSDGRLVRTLVCVIHGILKELHIGRVHF